MYAARVIKNDTDGVKAQRMVDGVAQTVHVKKTLRPGTIWIWVWRLTAGVGGVVTAHSCRLARPDEIPEMKTGFGLE